MIPDNAVAPFRLDCITLRGIGSYIHAAKLEIKPLTILCGTNSSGKSTWIRALNVLKTSSDEGSLPFEFSPDQDSGWYRSLLNAHMSWPLDEEPIQSIEDEDLLGTPGSVGLNVSITQETILEQSSYDKESDLNYRNPFFEFLVSGKLHIGDRINLLFTCPWKEDSNGPFYPIGFTLRFNESMIKFRFPQEGAGRSLSNGSVLYTKDLLSNGSCSDSIIELCPVSVSTTSDNFNYKATIQMELPSEFVFQDICNLAIQRVRQIAASVLNNFFHISAIRTIYDKEDLTEDLNSEISEGIQNRYVGKNGESTYALHSKFYLNTFLNYDLTHGASGFIDNYFCIETNGNCLSAFLFQSSSEIEFIFEHLFNLLQHDEKELLNNLKKKRTPDNLTPEDLSFIIIVFNNLLENDKLYDSTIWKELSEEESYYWNQGLSNISKADLIRFNRCLLDRLLAKYTQKIAHPGLLFNDYYSKWLEKLVNIRCCLEDTTLGSDWNNDQPPQGYLLQFAPRENVKLGALDHPRESVERYITPTIDGVGFKAKPSLLSSGFHQIAPMIIQSGLLKKFEICAIENPEVHLHPNLQIALTEFFLSQAKIGKYFLIETHSDLLIRRTIREILEESINQDQVRIYFSTIVNDKTQKINYSKIEKISINDLGQIDNWPEGFMDDDIKESRRLLDVMYGKRDDDDDE